MFRWATFLLTCGVWIAADGIRYRHFDDYLSSLDDREQAFITGDSEQLEGSGDEEETISPLAESDATTTKARTLPLRTGLIRSKDVTCCMLGQLAGDKGYHCYAKFYVARIIIRNQNRAHNRKMAFYGSESVPNYGTKLMRTFEQCVAGRGMIFHKCCHLAAIERKDTPHYDSAQRKKYQTKRTKYQKFQWNTASTSRIPVVSETESFFARKL